MDRNNYSWPQLFKGWITLSSGQITIQRISVNKTHHAIHWIMICPVDSNTRLSNWPGVLLSSPVACDKQCSYYLDVCEIFFASHQ